MVKRVLANEQYLLPQDRQKLAALSKTTRMGMPVAMPPGTEGAVVSGPNGPGAPVELLQQARLAMAEGQLSQAQEMLREAERFRAAYGPKDDTPAKVRRDLAKLREDRKALMTTARAALQAHDY